MSGADGQEAAAFYREEAEACRAIARLIATPIIVDVLLALAEEFERNATRAVALPRAEEPIDSAP